MWEILTSSRKIQKQLNERWHRLYRLAYAWSHDPHLASDLAQETIVKAIAKRHQLKDEKNLDAWLFSILNNCWRDHWRSKKKMIDIDSVDPVILDDPQEQSDIINSMRHAIAQLSFKQRQIITLIDLEEMSYKEVANILDIPIGTVMSRLCRARATLKTALLDLEIETGKNESGLRRIK